MKTLLNYMHYRRIGLRRAGTIAGIERVVVPVIQGAVIGLLILIGVALVTHRVEASQQDAVAQAVAGAKQKAEYVAALEKLLAKCLSKGDNPITIGNEIWMCGAAATGIKVRP